MIYGFIVTIFFAINSIPRWMAGDPYREGKLNIFLAASIFPIVAWIARRYDVFLAAGVALWIWLWCFYDSEGYGFISALGVPLFLAAAKWAARKPNTFSWMLRISVGFQLLLVAMHLCGFYPFEMDDLLPGFAGKPLGTMGNETLLAAFLAGLVPYAACRWTAIEAFLMMGGVIATGSTMGFVSMMAGLSATAWRQGKRWPAYMALAGIPALAFVALAFKPGFEFFSFSGRLLVWPIAWRYSLSRPLGWGPGAWAGLYPVWGVTWAVWDNIHNDILQFLHEGGWVCFPITAIGIFRLMSAMEAAELGGAAALLMNAAGNFTFHFAPTAFIFCFYLASAKKQEVRNGRGKAGSIRRQLQCAVRAITALDEPSGKSKNPRRGGVPKAKKKHS